MCFTYALLHIFLIPSNNIPQNALCLNGIEAANVIKFHLLTLYKKCPQIGRHFLYKLIYIYFLGAAAAAGAALPTGALAAAVSSCLS